MAQESWVPLRRFQVPAFAEMAHAFLVDHGVRAMLRGPSSTTHSLMRFAGSPDVQLLVPEAELDDAREALAALFPETADQPFRGPSPRLDLAPDDTSLSLPRLAELPSHPRPRNVVAVLLASSVLPIAAAQLSQGCRGEVVTRRRTQVDFALAPPDVDAPLQSAFAGRPSMGPDHR